MKKYKIFLVALGVIFIAISLLIPLIMIKINIGNDASMGIIGGADAPTYAMLYQEFKMYVLTLLGVVVCSSAFWIRK